MKFLDPEKELGPVMKNIAVLIMDNAEKWGDHFVYRESENGIYNGITWRELSENTLRIAASLKQRGFERGDKMVIFSPNRKEMLEMELAIMASGGISVPIFAFFHKETAMSLIRHSEAKWIAVAGELQLERIEPLPHLKGVVTFDDVHSNRFPGLILFNHLKIDHPGDHRFSADILTNDDVCLNMYTSGTMGIPKCVQLTHGNILSQQAALTREWDLNKNDRFLSYLPWHHSFGGIFERFSALYNGATINLDSGYGKDPKILFENWRKVQPTVFFSVPKVFQSLVDLTRLDKRAEETFFHSGLKFIFTAAASLPQKLSDEFEKRGIVVREGWGLTETSPCCTLTDPELKRERGVVGKPIAGVSIRLSDESEIQVKGPNVMKGYYKNDAANEKAFTEDGWFRTGDIGELTPAGLKLISRMDRVFKLVNGEKVVPSEVESVIQAKCHYISFAMVVGNGHEYPVALIFPNRGMFEHPDFQQTPDEGCFCPRSVEELGRCLRGCIKQANCDISEKFSRVKAALIINDELSIEKGTLTPSLKIAPNKVISVYKGLVEDVYAGVMAENEEIYVIRLDSEVEAKN